MRDDIDLGRHSCQVSLGLFDLGCQLCEDSSVNFRERPFRYEIVERRDGKTLLTWCRQQSKDVHPKHVRKVGCLFRGIGLALL